MATVEAAAAFSASASDFITSEDLVATPMTIVITEIREPIYIQIKDVIGN